MRQAIEDDTSEHAIEEHCASTTAQICKPHTSSKTRREQKKLRKLAVLQKQLCRGGVAVLQGKQLCEVHGAQSKKREANETDALQVQHM